MAANPDLDVLWAYRQPIEAALAAYFKTAPAVFGVPLSEHSLEALEHLREYTLRPGKRIRGSLAALAYDTAAGTSHAEQGIQLGVALELIQSYLLIIDDVMDNSKVRRGLPTVHELYLAEQANADDVHGAEMLAINVGYLAQHLANLVVVDIDVPAGQLQSVFKLLHTNTGITGFGQLDDLYQSSQHDVSAEAVLLKYSHKSSYYTFVNPLQLGFALAGKADTELLAAAEEFGVAAGIAFQLHDDYLGIFGNVETQGKSNLDDIREGKFTLMVQYALEHATAEQRATLEAILGNQAAGETELKAFQAILASTGADTYAIEQSQRYAETAKQSLHDRPLGTAALSQALADLVDYAVAREK